MEITSHHPKFYDLKPLYNIMFSKFFVIKYVGGNIILICKCEKKNQNENILHYTVLKDSLL